MKIVVYPFYGKLLINKKKYLHINTNLKNIILSGRTQIQKTTYCAYIHLYKILEKSKLN